MKKLLIILLALSLGVKGQTIKHRAFTIYYNAKIKAPDSVSWNLTPAMICKLVPRKDKFAQDPLLKNGPKPSDFVQLPAYKTDKTQELAQGHLFSYEDAMCNPQDNTECFYVDQMYSQYQSMNAGDWKTVEVYERTLAPSGTIHIIAGYVPHPVNNKGVAVPAIRQVLPTGLPIVAYMYKAIYCKGKWTAWIMPNLPTTKGHHAIGKGSWVVSIASLNKQTGLKLK